MSTRRKAPPKRKGYHHGDARSALLDVAAELVREQGAASFSLREAARRVGIDPSACYRHFRDRQELLTAIAQRGFVQLAAELDAASRKHRDARKTLLALGRAYVDYANTQPAYFRVMFGESGASARDPAVRAPELQQSAFEILQANVARWSGAPLLGERVEQVSLMLWAAVHGVARLVVDGALPLPPNQVHALVDGLCDAVLRGVEPA